MNNLLKKMCGEKLAKFLELNFSPDHILPVIKLHFNNSGHDIRYIPEGEWGTLKNLLNHLQKDEEEEEKINKSAKALLKEAGYTLYKCPTFKSYEKFKKYYRDGEVLCKFNDEHRAKNYHIFWIVKDGVEEGKILPSESPTRQDDYGTSVCSISVTKDKKNIAQICNRYNHTVVGCDNTFNSNLDNIISGLTEAFNKDFGFSINYKNGNFEFTNFCSIGDTFVYYFSEVNGCKIGNYTIVSDKIMNFSKDYHCMWGNYIIDLKSNSIVWNTKIMGEDSFVEYFNNTVKKVILVKDVSKVDDHDSDEICYIER